MPVSLKTMDGLQNADTSHLLLLYLSSIERNGWFYSVATSSVVLNQWLQYLHVNNI